MKKIIAHFYFSICIILLISISMQAQTGWFKVNPLPYHSANNDVQYVDSLNVIAVGKGIIQSLDGGSTWSKRNSGTNKTLRSVSFGNSKIGFAVGDSGLIDKTTDGGLTWNAQYISGVNAFNGVSSCDSNIVSTVGSPGKIYRTTNSGATWFQQPCATIGTLNSVHFINPTIGKICGSYRGGSNPDSALFFVTTNGGNNWTNILAGQLIDAQYQKVFFLSQDTGWLESEDWFGVRLTKTTNGGNTWTVGIAGIYTIPFSVISSSIVSAIRYCVGSCNDAMRTTNGGTNWFSTCSFSTNEQYVAMAFYSANAGIIISSWGVIKQTTDGGTTWTERFVGFNGNLKRVSFYDINTGVAVGDTGSIYRTTNTGSSWSRIPIQTKVNLRDVHLLNDHFGIAVGDSQTVLRTIDGGLTWSSIPFGATAILKGVHIIDDTKIIIIANGSIYRSSNGGTTWTKLFSINQTPLNGMYFIDANMGTVVGDSGKIIQTTDGGITWPQQNSGTTKKLNDVFFPDVLTGFAVGDSGKIIRTTNGGLTWVNQTSNTIKNLHSIWFTSSDSGYITANDGFILQTINKGKNWDRQISNTTYHLHDVVFLNKFVGIAVGDSGIILKTIDGGKPVELISFTAQLNEDKTVLLNWTTASETNNIGFEIERRFVESIDNSSNDWLKIGFIRGNGTTNLHQSYSFLDDISKINSRELYYRLKQIDADGTYTYSPMVYVYLKNKSESFILYQNYPNPFGTAALAGNSKTTIEYFIPHDGYGTIKMYNILGEEVSTLISKEHLAGNFSVEWNAANFRSGIYVYRMQFDGVVQSKKIVVIR